MPEYLKRTGRDVTDDILVRVPESEKHISRLVGPASKRLGIDRGDIPSVAAPLEGQMMIQYADAAVGGTPVSPDVGATFNGEEPYYFSNGEWRSFCCPTSTNPDQSRYECSSLTVPAGSSANVPFTQTSTDGIFDLTNPAAPVALVDAAYAVAAVVIGGTGWTPGSYLTGIMSFAASYQISVRHQSVADATGHMPTFSLSQTWRIGAGNGFWIELQSGDGSDHDVLIEPISALRILEYP